MSERSLTDRRHGSSPDYGPEVSQQFENVRPLVTAEALAAGYATEENILNDRIGNLPNAFVGHHDAAPGQDQLDGSG